MSAPEVSHGRGGAGNIHSDETKYVDGSVVRTGVEGSHGDGAYSVGRGGAGNIGDAGVKTPNTGRLDQDAVPSEAYRPSTEGDFHTGRGGLGNEHAAGKGGHKPLAESTSTSSGNAPMSFADKIKFKLFGKK